MGVRAFIIALFFVLGYSLRVARSIGITDKEWLYSFLLNVATEIIGVGLTLFVIERAWKWWIEPGKGDELLRQMSRAANMKLARWLIMRSLKISVNLTAKMMAESAKWLAEQETMINQIADQLAYMDLLGTNIFYPRRARDFLAAIETVLREHGDTWFERARKGELTQAEVASGVSKHIVEDEKLIFCMFNIVNILGQAEYPESIEQQFQEDTKQRQARTEKDM